MYRKMLFGVIIAAILSGCNKVSDSDRREAADLIKGTLQDTEVCLFDDDFEFPTILVGRKFAGKKLGRFDALVSAGLLREQVQILSIPKDAPKHLYHYTKHHEIELKTFDLTDTGRPYYRKGDEGGYFCYGRPELVEIKTITHDGAKNGHDIMAASFEYRVIMSADWSHNELIRLEFSKIRNEHDPNEPLIGKQQLVRDAQGSIVPVGGGALGEKYW